LGKAFAGSAREPSDIAAGSSKAGDQAVALGIRNADKVHRNRGRGSLGFHRAERRRDDDDVRSQSDQLVEAAAETFDPSSRPTDIDKDVLAWDISQLVHAGHEGIHEMLVGRRGARLEERNAPGLRIRLRAHGDRWPVKYQPRQRQKSAALQYFVTAVGGARKRPAHDQTERLHHLDVSRHFVI